MGKGIGILVGSSSARSGGKRLVGGGARRLTSVGRAGRCYDYSGGRSAECPVEFAQRDRRCACLRQRLSSPCRRLRRAGGLRAVLCRLAAPAGGRRPATRCCASCSAIAETSFDPQFASDAASDSIIDNIYEAMLDYDYLARPLQLVPRTLEAMPTVQDNGATYVFRVKKGIFFTPDPAFKGKPRELTAADHAYGIKRLLDPAVKSPWLWLVDGKIVGAERGAGEGHARRGRFDYDAPIPGLEVVDRYTLRIRLDAAGPALSLRARGAEHGGRRARGRRGLRPRLRRASGGDRARTCWASTSAARRSCSSPIPAIGRRRTCPPGPCRRNRCRSRRRSRAGSCRSPGRIEANVIEEGQAQWLAFLNREARPPRTAAVRFRRRGARRRQAEAGARGEGHPARDAAAAQHAVDLFQHGRSRRRRLHAGEDRAAPGDQHGVRREGARSACC